MTIHRRSTGSLLFLLATLAGCSGAPDSAPPAAVDGESASTVVQPPVNFSQVTDGIYRGGHPDPGNVLYLKSIGIKTIVDLEIDDLVEATPIGILHEEFDAWKDGIALERHPMSAFAVAVSDEFDQHMNEILDVLRDETKKPMYVHCKHGQDRTGLVIGLERVLMEKWTVAAAHDEMVRVGFHTAFLGLEEYFERKTGSAQP